MAECSFRRHDWDTRAQHHPGYEKAEFVCKVCGAGHRLEITEMPGGEQRVDITIFPAVGESRISRELIRWSILACEGTIQQMLREGVAVARGGVNVEGQPHGP